MNNWTSRPHNLHRNNSNGRTESYDFRPFFETPNWAFINGWREMPKPIRKERGFFPNRVFYHPIPGRRFVVVPLYIKGEPEHAATLGVNVVSDYYQKVEDRWNGKLEPGDLGVDQAWVAWASADGHFLGAKTMREIYETLDRAFQSGIEANRPNHPEFAPYYWINANGQVSSLDAWLGRAPADIAGF